MRMRAQISLEFLLIAAAFLAVLGLLIPIVVNTYSQTREQIAAVRARSALERLVVVADELCALGSGSRRAVEISFARETELNASGRVVSALGLSRIAVCEFDQFSANFTSRSLLLSNEGGKIRIS